MDISTGWPSLISTHGYIHGYIHGYPYPRQPWCFLLRGFEVRQLIVIIIIKSTEVSATLPQTNIGEYKDEWMHGGRSDRIVLILRWCRPNVSGATDVLDRSMIWVETCSSCCAHVWLCSTALGQRCCGMYCSLFCRPFMSVIIRTDRTAGTKPLLEQCLSVCLSVCPSYSHTHTHTRSQFSERKRLWHSPAATSCDLLPTATFVSWQMIRHSPDSSTDFGAI